MVAAERMKTQFALPLRTQTVIFELEWPVTAAEWELLHSILAAMEPALVRRDTEDGGET